ncbi:glycosyltransferase family 2 protein [Aquamicrobium sp. LC103]|uniref:glycosyltransferase family 2 protein n=1 Tax=Aquamicrobium sp. LC103 TaxID=1120658 RepID=UPI00069AEF54|nr:glycosyltransferase family 2 protein [Aquamicrobium sp. LC103]TKT69336.1 glycosyltransferase family 2 protein [Aquamicrobium sp. LC103]
MAELMRINGKGRQMAGPRISVVMANYNGARHIARALDSVLAQTVADLEIIISDDASSDESLTIVTDYVRRDPRVRLIADGTNGGPARARNRAFDAARGQWIAIVDSDDILHPERFERLLAAARHYDADAVADDLLHFADDGAMPSSLLLHGEAFAAPFRLTADLFVRGDIKGSRIPNFGYLKPMIRAEALRGLRYDEGLRIGEDYDLVLRLLLGGLKLQVVPEPTYLYRRHSQSISHRLSIDTVAGMIDSQKRLQATQDDLAPAVRDALAARLAGLERALAFEKLVASVKARQAARTAGLLLRDPRLLFPLWQSVRSRLSRKVASRPPSPLDGPAATGQLTVVLTDADPASPRLDEMTAFAQSHGSAEIQVEHVPPYSPPGGTNWNGGDEARASRCRLATLARRRELTLVRDGKAGDYAAGFLPLDGTPGTLSESEAAISSRDAALAEDEVAR